jgi:hypothetical protein
VTGRTLLGALAITVSVGGSAAGATAGRVISFGVAGERSSLGTTSDCPDGFTRASLFSRAGKRIGVSTLCALETSKREREGYAIGSVTQRVLERDDFRSGTIVSDATYVFRWITRDGSLAIVTMRGRVISATGRYTGAEGTISGNGLQQAGRQHLSLVIRLR